MELHFGWVVGCHGNSSMQFWEHLCTPTRITQGMLTNFGKFTKCSRSGAIVCPLNSSQDGQIAWMRACLCGRTSSHVPDLCSCHENHDCLVMNTTLCAVAQVVLCGVLNWWRQHEFWASYPIEAFCGAPLWLGCWMSRKQFDAILGALMYTDKDHPGYVDKFWEVHQMLKEWGNNMPSQFKPGWSNCLDESMSVWTNKFTCPRSMFVP